MMIGRKLKCIYLFHCKMEMFHLQGAVGDFHLCYTRSMLIDEQGKRKKRRTDRGAMGVTFGLKNQGNERTGSRLDFPFHPSWFHILTHTLKTYRTLPGTNEIVTCKCTEVQQKLLSGTCWTLPLPVNQTCRLYQ